MDRSPKRHSVRLRQEIATFVLILTIMQTAITDVIPSAQPVLEPVYLLKIVVYTDSDWTTVVSDDLSSFDLYEKNMRLCLNDIALSQTLF